MVLTHFRSCAKLSTVSSQSNPTHMDSSHRQGRFGLKWAFSVEHVARLHQEIHVFLLVNMGKLVLSVPGQQVSCN